MIKSRFTEKGFNTEQEEYFHDDLTGRDYGLIIGGMAWPTADGGAAVIIAEEFDSDQIWIVTDCDGMPGNIFKFMSGAAKRWMCKRWYGNGFDEAYMQMLHDWNRTHSGISRIGLIDAPFVEEQNSTPVYFQFIRDYAPKLHDGTDSDYSGKLSSVAEDLRVEKNEGEHFVSVLALGYALAAYRIYRRGQAAFNVEVEPFDERGGI